MPVENSSFFLQAKDAGDILDIDRGFAHPPDIRDQAGHIGQGGHFNLRFGAIPEGVVHLEVNGPPGNHLLGKAKAFRDCIRSPLAVGIKKDCAPAGGDNLKA